MFDSAKKTSMEMMYQALTIIFPARARSDTLENKLKADSKYDNAEGAKPICDFAAIDPRTIYIAG